MPENGLPKQQWVDEKGGTVWEEGGGGGRLKQKHPEGRGSPLGRGLQLCPQKSDPEVLKQVFFYYWYFMFIIYACIDKSLNKELNYFGNLIHLMWLDQELD